VNFHAVERANPIAYARYGSTTCAIHPITARTRLGTFRPCACTSETGIGSHDSSGSTSTRRPRSSASRLCHRGAWMFHDEVAIEIVDPLRRGVN